MSDSTGIEWTDATEAMQGRAFAALDARKK